MIESPNIRLPDSSNIHYQIRTVYFPGITAPYQVGIRKNYLQSRHGPDLVAMKFSGMRGNYH
jgi:hypothetical protein